MTGNRSFGTGFCSRSCETRRVTGGGDREGAHGEVLWDVFNPLLR